jgi:diaminopimelate epimerase
MVDTIKGNELLCYPKLSVNGNRLFYIEIEEDKKNSQENISNIFNNNPNIDSIIWLKKIEEDIYKMFVYERDGTCSNYCWNASILALLFLDKEKIFFEVNWKKIEVKKENNNIISNFSIENDLNKLENYWFIKSKNIFENFKKEFFNEIKEILKFYETNYTEIYKITKDKRIATYLINIISYIDKNDFLDFVKKQKIVGLVTSNMEPHLVIKSEISFERKKYDIYHKLLSFLIMNSFKDGEKIFPKSVNIMFVSPENKIYSCERWVINWIDYCKTWACGTWTASVAFLTQKKEYITRSWFKINAKEASDTIQLVTNVKNIRKLDTIEENLNEKQNYKHNVYTDAILEQIEYVLDYFWSDNLKELTENIINEINIKELNEIKKILWTFIFNSWWHENEFPIDPYKISTYNNQIAIEERFNIDGMLLYLDTMKTRSINFYPNISLGKNQPKVIKFVLSKLKNSDSYEEFKEDFKENYKKIFLNNNIAQSELNKTLQKNLWLEQKESTDIVNVIFKSNHTKIITSWFYKFFIKKIKNNWEKLKLNPQKRESLIFKWFQDYFLSIYIDDFYPSLKINLLNDNVSLFSESEFIKNIKKTIPIIYKSEILKNLIENYFKILIEEKGGKRVKIWDTIDWKEIFVDNEFGKIIYILWKNNIKIDEEKLISTLEQIKWFNWSIMLFILYLTWQLQIWSERWFREKFLKAIKLLNNKKFNKLAKYIELSYLTWDYVPWEKEVKKIPAWTDYTWTQDIYLSVLLWKWLYKKEIKSFINDYIHNKWIDKEHFFSLFFISIKDQLKEKMGELKKQKEEILKESLNNEKVLELNKLKKIEKNIEIIESILLSWLNSSNIKILSKVL